MKSKDAEQPIVIRQSKINAYAVKIEASWHKALESIFAVGDLINEARKELSHDEYRTLVGSDMLPFCARVAERLSAIANDKRLRKISVQKFLPPCWTTLDVIHRFSDDELQKAKSGKLITPSLTREEAISLRQKLTDKQSSRSKKVTKAKTAASKFISLIFEVPEDLENHKALLDVQFLCNLAEQVFRGSPGKSKITVATDGLKPSRKLLNSQNVLAQFIEEVRKIDNDKRARRGKKPLNEIQALLSFLGVEPENLSKDGFSLMERLVLAYARRHGINRVDEEQLKWFAATSETEPELLGSFMRDVKKQVASLRAHISSGRAETKIYELDRDIKEGTSLHADEEVRLGRRA